MSELLAYSPYTVAGDCDYFTRMEINPSESETDSLRTYSQQLSSGHRSAASIAVHRPQVTPIQLAPLSLNLNKEGSSLQNGRSPSERKSSGRKGPRVQNTGDVLAPHSSFTSVRVWNPNAARISATLSDSQQYLGELRRRSFTRQLLPVEKAGMERPH